jgi:hypothetical protein
MRSRLDMMMITINPKRTLEQRVPPILLNHYPCPPNIRPFSPRRMLQERIALENPILRTINRLTRPQRSISRQIRDRSALLNNIMIWLQRQPDPLLAIM